MRQRLGQLTVIAVVGELNRHSHRHARLLPMIAVDHRQRHVVTALRQGNSRNTSDQS